MTLKRKKTPNSIIGLDAFLAEGVASEEAVASLYTGLARSYCKRHLCPQKYDIFLVRNTKVALKRLLVKF